jgi:GH15 family glucan-1,4-alpha-glucosidase
LIGDCRTAALVSNRGSIDWLCLPNFSSPSVFARLLDPKGGCFSICPCGPFTATRRYVDDTAVLKTIFETPQGVVSVVDALSIVDGVHDLRPMREVLRVVEGRAGAVEMTVSIDPRPHYARVRPRLKGRFGTGWAYTWHNEVLTAGSDAVLHADETMLTGSFVATPGTRQRFSLGYNQGEPATIPVLGKIVDETLEHTLAWWRNWIERCDYQGPHKEKVRRSALVLKLMTFALSGAVLAAPTTSLPEWIGGDRNWDYRYCWLRDAGLTVQALLGLGYHDDAGAFLGWLLHATRMTWPRLQVVYDVYGRAALLESELTHFKGFRGSKPVRIGNAAYRQLQLDIYGQVILAADRVVSAGGRLDQSESRMLRGLGRSVCQLWREPDSSMWEIRGPRRHYTFSKVMCWVALDRLLKLADQGDLRLGNRASQFRRERDAIREAIEADGFNPALHSYASEFGGSHIEASMLLIGTLGYRDPNDPHIAGTLNLVMQRLARDGLIYRYEHEYDGMAKPEGAFGICSFWPIELLAMRGEVELAQKMFDHVCSYANDLGLFAEEINPEDGSALGNFPQAFTHVGLINAALAIERAKAGSKAC